jgi:TusA-related sulfurtransferase
MISKNKKRTSLNVVGLPCPYPEVLTVFRAMELKTKDVLEVTLDSPPSIDIIKDELLNLGLTISSVIEIKKNVWKIEIKN